MSSASAVVTDIIHRHEGLALYIGAGGCSLALARAITSTPEFGAIVVVVAGIAATMILRIHTVLNVAIAIIFFGGGAAYVLPSAAFLEYAHIPIVFATAARVYLSPDSDLHRVRWLSFGCVLLLVISVASGVVSGVEVQRGLLQWMILAAPLILVGAMASANLSSQERGKVYILLLTCIAVQVPVALGQLILGDGVDRIKGTFLFPGGQDVLAALLLYIAIWSSTSSVRGRLPMLGFSTAMLVFSRAGKALATMPFIGALVLLSRGGGSKTLVPLVVVMFVVPTLLVSVPNLVPPHWQSTALRQASLDSGTLRAVSIAHRAQDDALARLIGSGPASTVSGTAYITTDPVRLPSSAIRHLNIEPASIPISLGALEGFESSVSRPRSSVAGIYGDLGILGLLCVVSLWWFLFLTVMRNARSINLAGGGTILMCGMYAVVSSGWEMLSLTMLTAVLCGVALMDERDRNGEESSGAR